MEDSAGQLIFRAKDVENYQQGRQVLYCGNCKKTNIFFMFVTLVVDRLSNHVQFLLQVSRMF